MIIVFELYDAHPHQKGAPARKNVGLKRKILKHF